MLQDHARLFRWSNMRSSCIYIWRFESFGQWLLMNSEGSGFPAVHLGLRVFGACRREKHAHKTRCSWTVSNHDFEYFKISDMCHISAWTLHIIERWPGVAETFSSHDF